MFRQPIVMLQHRCTYLYSRINAVFNCRFICVATLTVNEQGQAERPYHQPQQVRGLSHFRKNAVRLVSVPQHGILSYQCRHIMKNVKKRNLIPSFAMRKVVQTGELIYESSLSNYMFWGRLSVYFVSLPTVCIGVYGLLMAPSSSMQDPSGFYTGSYFPIYLLGTSWALLMMSTVNFLSARVIHQIYYDVDRKKYTAIVLGNLISNRMIEFTEDDCIKRDLTDRIAFSVFLGNFYIKDKCYFLNWKNFTQSVFYNRLMHYEESTEHP